MNAINATLTPQASTTAQQSAAAGKTALSASGKGIFAAQGLDFLSLLLGTQTGGEQDILSSTATTAATATATATATTTETDTTGGETSLDILETILNLDNPTDPLQGITTDGEAEASAVIPAKATGKDVALDKASRKNLYEYLQSLLEGMPVDSRPVTIPNGEGKGLQTETDTDATPGLIATGMSPEDITAFLEELNERMAAGESFVVGLVKILPPQAKKEIIFHPRAMIVSGQTGEAGTPSSGQAGNQTTTPAQEQLASSLNDLMPGTDTGEAIEGEFESKKTGFDRVLEVLEGAQQKKADAGQVAPGLDKAIANAKNHSASLSTIFGQSLPEGEGMMFSASLSGEIFPDGADWQIGQGAQGPNLSLNGPAMMASLVANVPHATHAHPATHTIAATVSKAAGEGENKNITVRLDPPDLGRVEIRMEFTKEKTAKVHLLVEKQETWLMLQRDVQMLQKALAEAGLDAGGSELSFELAQDSSLFDHGSHKGGGQNASGGGDTGTGSGEGEDVEIIQASVDWYVDPDTGLTRYDLLA